MSDTQTLAALAAALDASTLRQQVISTNIANANVAGFVPSSVSFSARIDALRATDSPWGSTRAALSMETAPRVDANGVPQAVRIDEEVARLSQNALNYQALVKGLNHHLGLIGSAVTEGKR